MKGAFEDPRHRACGRKRRYRSQGDALDAALLAGVERERIAYPCRYCGKWHLATRGPADLPPRGSR